MTKEQHIKDAKRLSAVRIRVVNTIRKLCDRETLNDFQTDYLRRLNERKFEIDRRLVRLMFIIFPTQATN